jgi:LCP family protein required for cell wall assembly
VRLLRKLLISALALVLASLSVGWWWLNSGATVVSITRTAAAGHDWTPDKPLFVLLLGDDQRYGLGCGCTDSIHVVGIAPGGGRATMIGIPRDTRVEVRPKQFDRINAAWQIGGNDLAATVIGKLVGVPITYVVHVNFLAFPKLVDDIGGVDVNVVQPMFNADLGLRLKTGVTHMNGDTSLAFNRDRHLGAGDLTRSENQGRFIIAALSKMRGRGTSPLDTLGHLATLARHTDTTGVSTPMLYRLARLALSIDPANVRNVVVPTVGQMINNTSYQTVGTAAQGLLADFADDAVLQSH